MSNEAARVGDMHTCPDSEPGPVPHVGGPILSGDPTVVFGYKPAARVGDPLLCIGAQDRIATASASVLIGNQQAARMGDTTVHGGRITAGDASVILGPAIPERSETIVQLARSYLNQSDWSYLRTKDPFPANTNKCNLFVYDILTRAGAVVPMEERFSWRQLKNVPYPPLAGQWADPDHEIPGWTVVTDPQPGDVVAEKHDYSDASGHVGIVTGQETSISQSSFTDTIQENDWGFRPGQQVVFRRYTGDGP